MIFGLTNEKSIRMRIRTTLASILLSVILTLGIIGCSAKTSPVVSEDPEIVEARMQQIVNEIEKEDNSATENDEKPCKYGSDSAKTMEKQSLYYEYFKQGNYIDAYPHWQYLVANAPCYSKGIYVNGEEILSSFIKDEKNSTRKEVLIDSLIALHDQRIEYYDQKGFVLGKKGSDLFKFRPKAYEEAYQILKESVDLEKEQSGKTVLYYWAYSASFMMKYEKIQESELINTFLTIIEIINTNDPSGTDKGWQSIYSNTISLLGDYLKCETLVNNFKSQFENNKDNLNMLKQFQSTLEARKCIDNDTYVAISESVYSMEPSAKAANNLGIIFNNKQQYDKAIFYFEEAMNKEEDKILKSKYALSVADVYRIKGNFPTARSYAQKAADFNPEDGTPYMFIGNLYTKSANSCGSTSFEKKAVYWVAVDMYYIAKSKGSEEANDVINRLTNTFPTKEDAFYQDPPVKEGESYTVGCWINVTTKARFVQ
jgi:tetratricopeptide (TPR) repeat protein